MSSGGLLSIQARYTGQGIASLSVALNRPPVTRLFIGQAPEVVVKTVPYIYTLCAAAQRAAAQAALAAAQGIERRPVDDGELWTELLHENFWRLLLDWPAACGQLPGKEAFVAWRSERLGEHRLVATQKLLQDILPRFAERCLEQLGAVGDLPVSGFPVLQPAAWLAYWQGAVADEPAPRWPASIAGALLTRLHETQAAAEALAKGTPFPVAAAGDDGWGVGQTLTARGVLTHAARVREGRVVNYRVWAPTDCHFADAHGLQALLAGRPTADLGAARQAIDQAVLALDPCLPYVVEIEHA